MNGADIYITIGASQIKEKGWRKFVNDFKICDGEFIWYYRMKNLPTRPIRNVYIVAGNKVRFAATFVELQKNKEVHFSDGQIELNNWMILVDFVSMPRPLEIRKGFQGFRYKEIL